MSMDERDAVMLCSSVCCGSAVEEFLHLEGLSWLVGSVWGGCSWDRLRFVL